ncbi:hypothetical protein U732_4287 [Clostridium argentinense CDC 2741]|uniref:DUF1015 domain-containing protein n=1 Tax=Clostridium argentinense CDC 2741 TaxID=1418104 RepID=A0A0C1R4P1_9CLOT|nr:DUF1015 family protein [Clostridium argentinense]ARC83254.1 hypothetical protein RSJ17_00995 [Clostridium argentinense]KIE48452.1 hypothetical protein U732_4287 [Clostridium argentinense CDC 2741]NFF41738.1 DUF1015 domain-containing protein [Clostridium argentinense]NFP52428.1 DUF1015 domain-containing protein [Clostridium argentinense]NFP74743.1 DUF1015 domain-containing protein [Clostridium argentinense]
MAVVRPFKGIRPQKELVDKVAALPYDVMNTEEAREMVKGNPYSFLHVDKAQIDLDPSINQYDKGVYEKARENLYNMIDEKVYIKDNESCMYIYRQIMDGRVQTGIVGCTSIDDYMKDIIKKHEHTRAEKEQDRINHVDYCNANTGPIFLTYKNVSEVDKIVIEWTKKEPEYNFVSEDGITHIVWVINDKNTVDKLENLFKEVKYLYIADGHHRAASAVKVGQLRREQNPQHTGEEEFNFFLSVIFPAEDLYVMDYNRVVKDLNDLSTEEFLSKVSEKFDMEAYNCCNQYKPEEKGTFGMYLDKKWYKLTAKKETFDEKDPVASLDVSILQNNLLRPLLGIEDPRTSDRIDFIGGIRGLKELEKRVDNGMKVAFSMYPTSIVELMNIADAGEVMPPKSTWFEPKLRSGIFVHELE